METIAWIKEIQANIGKPGFNEYGVPLHACNGYRHDEHYWAWIRASRELKCRLNKERVIMVDDDTREPFEISRNELIMLGAAVEFTKTLSSEQKAMLEHLALEYARAYGHEVGQSDEHNDAKVALLTYIQSLCLDVTVLWS